MGQVKKINIGFVLTPGFRAADLIEVWAIFGLHPRNKAFFIAENKECVYGKSDFPIVPSTTFRDCLPLDVLVVGEQPDSELENENYIEFIRKSAANAAYVIGISRGVIALAKTGLLANLKATADKSSLHKLTDYGVIPVDQPKTVVDGKFYTSGPSTGAIESGLMVLRKLRGDFVTRFVELTLEYNPKKQFAEKCQYNNGVVKQPKPAKPLKVAVLMAPFVYAPDVMGALDVLGAVPGTEIYYVWKEERKVKCTNDLYMEVSTTFEKCPQVDVLVVGAVMPVSVFSDQEVLDFIVKQEKQARAIISVCGGTFVIGSAGLLKDRHAASNFHMTGALPCVGAIPSYKEVQVDGKFYSAGPAVGSYEVGLMAVNDICGEEWAAYIEQEVLEYEPNPVMKSGSPELAGKWLTFLSKLMIAPFIPISNWHAKKGYKRNVN